MYYIVFMAVYYIGVSVYAAVPLGGFFCCYYFCLTC